MFLRTLLLVGLALTSAQAQMDDDAEGVCVPAMMSNDSPINIFNVGEGLTGCLKDVKFSKEQLDAFKTCDYNNKMKALLMDSSKTEETIMSAIVSVAECGLDELGLAINNKKDIDYKKAVKLVESMKGPKDKIDFLVRTLNTCKDRVEKTNGSANAVTKHLLIYSCFTNESYKYCINRKEDPGAMAMQVAMESLFKPGMCQSVDIKSRILPVLNCGIISMVSKMKGGLKAFKMMANKFTRKSTSTTDMVMKSNGMFKLMQYVGKALGLINPKTGAVQFDVLRVLIMNANGWMGIEDKRDQIIKDITECEKLAPFNTYPILEIVTTLPYIPIMSPTMFHLYKFHQCFLPRLAQTCGLRNQLGFCAIPAMTQFAPKKMILEVMVEDPVLTLDRMMDDIIDNLYDLSAGCT